MLLPTSSSSGTSTSTSTSTSRHTAPPRPRLPALCGARLGASAAAGTRRNSTMQQLTPEAAAPPSSLLLLLDGPAGSSSSSTDSSGPLLRTLIGEAWRCAQQLGCQRTYVVPAAAAAAPAAAPGQQQQQQEPEQQPQQEAAAPAVTQELLDWLAALYAAVGAADPCWDVVPCLPCAGWTPERVAALADVQVLLASEGQQPAARALQQRMRAARDDAPALTSGGGDGDAAGAALPALQLIPLPPHLAEQQQQQQQQAGQQQPQQPQQQPVLQFEAVAVGGTFDRLHAGHRLLLAATALVATHTIYVGITADNLLAKKANKHLLQDYEGRRAGAVGFMEAVRPGVVVAAGALTDPQEPTQAELDPSMQALVVSQETLSGGEAINAGRRARGFPPLQLVVVGLVGGDGGSSDSSSKLSSTQLRQQAADAAAGSAGGAR